MDKLRMKSLDASEGNVAKIAALFPHCVTERLNKDGKPELAIDFDKLRAGLSNDVLYDSEERYQFTWPDKRAASRLANEPVNLTLRPCREESVDFDTTENLYIEGDNLDVLKVLRETYLGRVKMIYIDPPYNTGNDFVYNDDFAQSREDFEATSGAFDDDGNQLIDPMQRNTESNGRFHTDWLNMIYPRLKVARDLLSDDGVIFISIDDNEIENLRKICDEIFGQANYLSQLVIENNPRGRQSDSFFATSHEYLLCYAKQLSLCEISGMPLSDEQKSEYKFVDNNGHYRLLGLRQRGVASLREDRPDMFFPIYVDPVTEAISLSYRKDCVAVIPKKSDGREGRWMWGMKKCETDINRLVARFIKGRNEYDIFVKDYLASDKGERTRKYKTIWSDSRLNNQNGTQEVKKILGGDYMSFPKSSSYIQMIINLVSEKDAIILDFFSGSATTAHAVMKLNAEDGGHRKFIMVQLPEVTDEKSEAHKAGYETICQIGEERIRRAGEQIRRDAILRVRQTKVDDGLFDNDYDERTRRIASLPDTGFRVLKLDTSNMEDVFYTPEDFDAQNIFTTVDNVKSDRTPLDLLFQVMPELNIELSAKIEEKEVNGKKVFFVDGGYLIATFDMDVNESTVTEVAKMKPQYFVMRDASAANDNVLDNFEQIFRHYSPDTIRKIL